MSQVTVDRAVLQQALVDLCAAEQTGNCAYLSTLLIVKALAQQAGQAAETITKVEGKA